MSSPGRGLAGVLAEGLDARGVCSHPVPRLSGGKLRPVRCGSKDALYCRNCAELAKNDAKRLIGSGCRPSERDGVTDQALEGFRFFFVTLTAPSFGKVHREGGGCPCGLEHVAGSGWRGVAVDPSRYDYAGAVKWNGLSSRLWNRSMKYLGTALPVGIESAVVREWQARGSIHVHAIIRVPSWVSTAEALTALRRLRTYRTEGIVWGRQVDVREIEGESTRHRVRYLGKALTYSVKSLADDQSRPEAAALPSRVAHFDRLASASRRVPCARRGGCDGPGCTSLGHRRNGYAGHMVSVSRGWSLAGLTRGRMKEERVAWMEEHRPILEDQPLSPGLERLTVDSMAEQDWIASVRAARDARDAARLARSGSG